MIARARLSRRALLSGSAAALALSWTSRTAPAAADPAISDRRWEMLAKTVTGGVIRPGDARFVALTRPENLRYYNPPSLPGGPVDPDAPFAVVRPRDPKEVAATILWAQEAGCRMVPRSGGHSYAGCSTVPGLVIHAESMRQVNYHAGSGLLEVGGGALNGDLFAALKRNNRSIVHGRCATVGVSAYMMGGGIGLAMREYGVGCDQVQSVELVLANGRTVRAAAANEYKDLFWAVRGGGGGNLAFATRWWLHTAPADKLIAFNANWWPDAGGVRDIFRRLVRGLEASPEQMGAQMSLYATSRDDTGPNRISLIGQYRGSLAQFQKVFGNALSDAAQKTVLELPYWDAQEFFEIDTAPNRYQETSLFADELSDACIDKASELLRTLPGPAADARLTFFLTGGRINKVKPDATAFVHRSSQWLINTILEWRRNDEATDYLTWQRQAQDAFSGILGGSSSYQNFPDPGLNNHAEVYWGANLPRLSRIKHVFDPKSVFTPPRHQEIPQPV